MRILTTFGASALAGYTIALRIIVVALLPAWGMSNAVATLVGQNLGAGKPERAERSVWIVGLYNMAFLLAVMGVFLWGAEPLIAVFSAEPSVQRLGAQCLQGGELRLRLLRLGHGAGAGLQRCRGHGHAHLDQPGLLLAASRSRSLSGSPAGLGLGPLGVFLAITLAESLLAVVGLLAFRRGTWKERSV